MKKIIPNTKKITSKIFKNLFNMKPQPKKKLPNKKVISSAKFEAKEQFTKSALENLKTENERLVNSLKKSGEIKQSKRK